VNALAKYREERGLTDQQIADELAALLGKTMSAGGVKLHASRKTTPKAWREALGLTDPDEPRAEEPEPTFDPGGLWTNEPPLPRPDAEAPTPPGGARFQPPTAPAAPGGDYAIVRDRIAKFYGAVGAGVSMVTQNDGYGAVANAYSGDLADAWVAAAKQNENVRRIVAFLESGGPVGELVIAHLILVGGFVYVSGRGPALDFLYAGKFSQHRLIAASRLEPVYEPGFDGGGQNGAAYSVADAATPPGG
jgi:hypothetical protein